MKLRTLFLLFLFFLATSALCAEPKIFISGAVVGESRFLTVREIESISLISNGSLKLAHTTTVDKKQKTEFEGVPLIDVLKKYGAEGVQKITVKAWDRYTVTIGIDDIKKFSLILATREGGRHISYKDRGPARIVTPQIQSETEQLKEKVQIFAVREIVFIK